MGGGDSGMCRGMECAGEWLCRGWECAGGWHMQWGCGCALMIAGMCTWSARLKDTHAQAPRLHAHGVMRTRAHAFSHTSTSPYVTRTAPMPASNNWMHTQALETPCTPHPLRAWDQSCLHSRSHAPHVDARHPLGMRALSLTPNFKHSK